MTANQAHTFTINKLFVTESSWIVLSVFPDTEHLYTANVYGTITKATKISAYFNMSQSLNIFFFLSLFNL